MIVPPVPTPATNTSILPSSASQSSGPVVRRCASGLAGLENWSGRKTSSRVAIRWAAVDSLMHATERLGDLEAGAVERQQALALAAHPLRQREHQVIALGGADERQRDPGVAAGGLDDRRAPRLDPPLALGRLDHRQTDAILDAAARIERLDLCKQRGSEPAGGTRVSCTTGVLPT